MALLTLLGLLGLLVLVLRAVRTPVLRRHGVPLRNPPDSLPVLGNGIVFLQARQTLFSWFVRCQLAFGPETVQVAVPTLPPGVLLTDPRNLDYVFRHEGTLVHKGAFVRGMLWDLFGHGIVNADGDAWRVQRKAGLAFLHAANVRALADVALPRYLDAALAALRDESAAAAAGTPVDLQHVFLALTTRLMGRMAYDMDFHGDPDMGPFTAAFELASRVTTERFQNPLWPLTERLARLVRRGPAARLPRALAVVRAFGHRIVAAAVRRDGAENGPDAPDTPDAPDGPDPRPPTSGSLIQALLDAIPDHAVVADAALNYLSAGRDTVAQGLTWTLYRLLQHPAALDRVRREVAAVLAASSSSSSFPSQQGPYVACTPAALPYTRAVFYEGLRLHPPIPFEIKQVVAPRGLVLPDGTALPNGALVLWCAWALNRCPRTWGPDADRFRPERWLDEESSASAPRLRLRPPAEFPVFHGGPRTCLGKSMAEALAVPVLAAVTHAFDLELAEPAVERVSRTSLTLPMHGGLPCLVRPRATA